jgi:NADH kinase
VGLRKIDEFLFSPQGSMRQIMTDSVLLLGRAGCHSSGKVIKSLKARIQELGKNIIIAEDRWNGPGNPDFVVTVGGDGTLLRAASLFPKDSPTFLPISGGTLGFMLPLCLDEALRTLETIYKDKSPVPTVERMRLQVRISVDGKRSTIRTALNDVNVHRGGTPSLARMDCHIDGNLLTLAVSDGLLVSTPTGSTAYSLSAGGPIVHPQVGGILLTPICPRSLSFRPAVLPPSSEIRIRVSDSCRGPVQVSVDGNEPMTIPMGAEVTVTRSKYSLHTICRSDATEDWVHSINSLLAYNSRFSERVVEDE